MKIKPSELIDITLDWAIAKSEGYFSGDNQAYWESREGVQHFIKMRDDDGHGVHWTHSSTEWSEGGPIIERERIELNVDHDADDNLTWHATIESSAWSGARYVAQGPGPLIAAMRCFVASKLGNEVEISDELI